MNKNNSKQIEVKIKADKNVIPAGKPGERIIEIEITAPSVPENNPQNPLNLSLVIDRSGSMHGEKLHYVKQAAAHVVNLMGEKDRLALVTYDDQVQVLQSSQFLTDKVKTELKAKIRGIESGGSTFLYGGWLAGCKELAIANTRDYFNRTLLLTDGLANVGERDVDHLSIHAQELFARGVSTSCFGVGMNYDEHLLESMANHGGGSFHFLETLNAIPLVFEREFEDIINVSLKDIKITLELPDGVNVNVSANWQTEKSGNTLTISIGSLVAERSQAVYLKLANLMSDHNQTVEIPIEVTASYPEQKQYKIEQVVSFKAVYENEEIAIDPDQELMARFAVVDLADKANEALKLEREGDRAGSYDLMQQSIQYHDKNITAKVREKYEYFSNEVSQGLNEAERKRQHFQEYQSKRGWNFVRDYRLLPDKGALIAEIEGKTVLINSGAKISIGRENEWFFLNQLYSLPHSHDGVDCERISAISGKNMDVMMGMDILKELYIRIDPIQGVVQFSRQPLHVRGLHISMTKINNGPYIKAVIDGKILEMRLETGLKFSYVPEYFLLGATNLRQENDAIPGMMTFQTHVGSRMLELGGEPIPVLVGTLTEDIRHLMQLADNEGVLGDEFFRKMPSTLAFPDRELILKN